MSNINWYPGHMAKSFRELEKHLKLVDIVMILLDARIPKSSMNPEILKRVKHKPTLILLNKSDLADKKILAEWENYYKKEGFYTLQINATDKKGLSRIYPLVKNVILHDKVEKILSKGRQLTPFKTMILGIPNVGKSTLINNLGTRQVQMWKIDRSHSKIRLVPTLWWVWIIRYPGYYGLNLTKLLDIT